MILIYLSGPPLSLIYLCGPHPSLMLLLTKKIISTLFIYILEYTYINFIYNTILFLNILFKHNASFNSTSKNVVNTCCYMQYVSWTWQTFASCWMSGWSVISDKRSKAVTYLWQEKSYPAETRFNQIQPEKLWENNKICLPSGLPQMQERRKRLIQIKFEVFYSSGTASLAHSIVTVAL